MDNNNQPLHPEIQKELDRLEKDPYESLARQCNAEYRVAFEHQKERKQELLQRLKVYNNQRRDKEAVGDTTMFSIFQTMLAVLYVDKLGVKWAGREEGDSGVAENLNAVSEYDYTEMEKDITDYDWIWDTLFFSRGLLELEEYIRDPDNGIYLPVPRVIDPFMFLRDPRAISINGNRLRKGSARFFGEDMKMTQDDIKNNPHAVGSNIDFRSIKIGSGTESLLEDGKRARDEAQGLLYGLSNWKEKDMGANAEYDVTVWNTNWKVGGQTKKIKVWLANKRQTVIGFKVYKNDKWKVIDRPLYPTSHSFDGTSIPDLTEDKQRAKAVAKNLGLRAIKADLYPSYIYDTNKIKNKNDLNIGFNKFIGADVPEGRSVQDALMPLRKAVPNLPLLNFIIQSLDTDAQKATATSDLQQGIQPTQDRTLGENNLVVQRGDVRSSLSAKIFGWSERNFWREWYNCYKENFASDIDEKVIRIVGAYGEKWRKYTKDQFVTKKLDPDVKVDSLFENRTKELQERQELSQYLTVAMQDPTINRRYALKELGKSILTSDRMDRLFPPTVDERIAREENEMLNENKNVQVRVEDNHETHLEEHNKATDTKAKFVHIATHQRALSIKKIVPGAFPPDQQQQPLDVQGGQNQPNGQPQSQNPGGSGGVSPLGSNQSQPNLQQGNNPVAG